MEYLPIICILLMACLLFGLVILKLDDTYDVSVDGVVYEDCRYTLHNDHTVSISYPDDDSDWSIRISYSSFEVLEKHSQEN